MTYVNSILIHFQKIWKLFPLTS